MKRDIHAVSVKEGKFLFRLARDTTIGGCIVEVGSWKGYSTIQLAKGAKAGPDKIIYAIDPHTGSDVHHQMYGEVSTLDEFNNNTIEAGVRDIINPMVMTSKEAEVAWKADALPIALLFIDGDHEDTEDDFLRWEPYVVSGGVIAIHDTTTWPSKVPYRTAVKYLYKSKWFWPVRRVGSITYAVKTNRYNALQQRLNLTWLVFRSLWQATGIPCLNKTKYYVGRILGKV